MKSNLLLTKPLRDALVGVQRKLDRYDDTIAKNATACISYFLIELAQIDSEVNRG